LNVQNKITLNSFITYIEEQIIKKYNLDSYSPVGIENIVFNNNSDANIGSFKINIDFE
jgi:hypothetical protein